MTPLEHQVALTALNKMLRSSFFSICEINDIADMLGIPARDTKAYRILHTLHCVHWGDMLPEVRDAVPDLIRQCLGTPVSQFSIHTEVVDFAQIKLADPPVAFRERLMRLLRGNE